MAISDIIKLTLAGTTDVTTTQTAVLDTALLATLNVAGTNGSPSPIVTISSVVGLTAGDNFDVSNGTLDFNSTAALSLLNTFNVGTDADNGGTTPGNGTLELGSGINVSLLNAIHFAGNNDSLVLDKGLNVTLGGGISGFNATDNVDLRGVTGAQSAIFAPAPNNAPGGTIEIFGGPNGTGTELASIRLNDGTFAPNAFQITSDGHGGTEIFVCFLRGTRLATPAGERAVEDLAQGDLVRTAGGVAVPVKWIGSRRIEVSSLAHPELGQPICFRRGSISDAVPHRDLLVSPDHAMLVGSNLVPAKLLVNGATIIQRRDIAAMEYFHVELDRHDILLAEGAAAESYLDTGNRGFFQNGGSVIDLRPHFAIDPARDLACLKLTLAAEEVRPIWQSLAERAASLGYALPDTATTSDPDMVIEADGQTIRPVALSGNKTCFVLPSGTRSIVLSSRSDSPNSLHPWIDDRRRLGVSIGGMILREDTTIHTIALDDPALTDGWFAPESFEGGTFRWTNGAGVLALPRAVGASGGVLEVHLVGSTLYRSHAIPAGERRAA